MEESQEIVEEVVDVQPESKVKEKKPRTQKQIEAFEKARLKKQELAKINKEFNDAKKKQKEDVIEHKKRIIKTVKQPVEEEEQEEVEEQEESEEEEIIIKKKPKQKKKPIKKRIIYADTSSEDEDEDDENAKIINYAKMLKKTARQNMKEELNRAKIEMAMASLGYT
jgi:hypothetical protein